MSASGSLRHWLATANAAPARWARSALRTANRIRARQRSGSLYAEMDRTVAEATDTSVGSGLAVSIDERVRDSRRRALRNRAHAGGAGTGTGTGTGGATR